VHLHIRRLVIDAAVGDGHLAPADLEQRLQASLSAAIGDGSAVRRPAPHWVDGVASAVAAQVGNAVPSGEAT
jgi:hypothetical protein